MSKVKRYNHMANRDSSDGAWYAEMYEADDGLFVLAEDSDKRHAEMETRCAELEAEMSVLIMDLESCEEGGGEGNRILRTRIAELEAKIRELREVLEMLPHETGATVRQDAERVIELVAQLRAEIRRYRQGLRD